MNNIRTVFFGMLKRLKYALVIALLVGAGSIGLYYCGRPIANVFSVNDKIDIALSDNDKSESPCLSAPFRWKKARSFPQC